MYLSRHQTSRGSRWALDGRYLPEAFTLGLLLELPAGGVRTFLESLPAGEDPLLASVEPRQEVWPAG